ncbi:MAG TPA: Ig-like domain-containing protein [Longimicrobium sp.]|nr:Ig-like domain-containing protein [Longimicrobium sp.]
MGYDPQQCLDNLNSKQLAPACQNLSVQFHCDDVTGLDPALHAACATAGIYYFPVKVIICKNNTTQEARYFPGDTVIDECDALHDQDRAWKMSSCYCCCSCLANDTLVALADGGFAQISTIPVGASVLAGSVAADEAGVRVSWAEAMVRFSQGTDSSGHQPLMIYLTFGPDGTQELICNTDQPFLLADGMLTTAGKLRPGQQLVGPDNGPLEIKLVSMGRYEGGVHHIATDIPWAGSANGHLLLAGGVVAGDWALQMHFKGLSADLKEDDHDALPLIGTPEYEDMHQGTLQRADALFEFVSNGAAQPATARRNLAAGVFQTYRAASEQLPGGAQALFTPGQASDIVLAGSQAPLSNPIPQALFNSVRAQLAGFYPDVVFHYDALDVTPNVYAFEAYGKQVVQMTGGLARLQGFNYEGLFMAMAHGVACFHGGTPLNASGHTAVGQADAYAFGVISRLCWIGDPFLDYVMEAISQWSAVFGLVTPDNAGGTPGDPLNDPSLDCRVRTIRAAAGGGRLPECAGGTPTPRIGLAKAVSTPPTGAVLTFTLAVDAATGQNVANYAFTPGAKVTSATLDETTGFIVHLGVELEEGTQYQVTVQNLVSILGSGIDPGHASAPLTAAPAAAPPAAQP